MVNEYRVSQGLDVLPAPRTQEKLQPQEEITLHCATVADRKKFFETTNALPPAVIATHEAPVEETDIVKRRRENMVAQAAELKRLGIKQVLVSRKTKITVMKKKSDRWDDRETSSESSDEKH